MHSRILKFYKKKDFIFKNIFVKRFIKSIFFTTSFYTNKKYYYYLIINFKRIYRKNFSELLNILANNAPIIIDTFEYKHYKKRKVSDSVTALGQISRRFNLLFKKVTDFSQFFYVTEYLLKFYEEQDNHFMGYKLVYYEKMFERPIYKKKKK